MLKYILVLLVVTHIIVARVPHGRQKRSCANCGKLVSHSASDSWSSSSDSSESVELADTACKKHKSSSSGDSSSNEISIDISENSIQVIHGYKDYLYRKRVKHNYDIAIACERDKLRITCPTGYIIKIISANYGRTCNKYCADPTQGNITVTDCYCPSAYDVVSWYCTDANYCQIPVNNYVFYDMCPGVYKYLEVVYDCIYVPQCKDKVNMRFTTCSPCDPATCKNPGTNILTDNCVPGCVCTGNTVLTDLDGYCVNQDMCPWSDPAHPECSGNEVFSTNATKCQPSCQNGGVAEDPCPYPPENGYVCVDGKVRNEVTGRCVDVCSCPCDSLIKNQ